MLLADAMDLEEVFDLNDISRSPENNESYDGPYCLWHILFRIRAWVHLGSNDTS